MAVVKIENDNISKTMPDEYLCLSTDTKPIFFDGKNVTKGSTMYATDTKETYLFNGASWILM